MIVRQNFKTVFAFVTFSNFVDGTFREIAELLLEKVS
jgi:hypothetical protein